MPDHSPVNNATNVPTLNIAFQSIAQSVAASIVDALAQPLQQEIESRVNAIIAEATKDINNKIAVAIGQIQPIQIPINLLAQPIVQPVNLAVKPYPEAVAALTPTPSVPSQAALVTTATTAPAPESESESDHTFAAMPEAQASDSDQEPLKKDKERTPKKGKKNFAATIVGLLPGQAHMIKNDFKFAKLSFVRADARNSSQLVALAKSHNPVVFMTDFVRHASVESVRSAHGNWVYVTGGMNTLRDKLHELYEQHQSSQASHVRVN